MNKDQQRELERINDLKLRGQKIEVKIDDCKIVGGYDKIVDDGEVVSDFAAGELTAPLAVLYVFPGDEPKEDSDVEVARIIFKTTLKGRATQFVSPLISQSSETVEFLFAGIKSTWIYVDPSNTQNFWFDLDFLNI